MRYYLILVWGLILCMVNTKAFAQRQTNIWYFGGKGLDFNYTPMRVLTDNAMKSSEGVASIADENGKLLFYTNGEAIWNKTHTVMANGLELAGNISSRQGVIIVPQPGSRSLYYVFTTDSFEKNWVQGLRYSVVDMSRQRGVGEVVRKNVFLQPLAEENLTATGSCDCPNGSKQYWLAADRADEPGYLYAYRIDNKGILPQAEISFLSGVANITYLKFSPTGNQIAFTGLNTAQESIIGLADFDQITGLFSNPKLFLAGQKSDYHRALEFSGNGKVLYFTSESYGPLTQYDLTQTTADKIAASGQGLQLPSSTSSLYGPQLASDGKIYLQSFVSNSPSEYYLSVINYPNLLGSASSYQENVIPSSSAFMLPNFVTNYFYSNDTLSLNLNAGPDQQVCGSAPVRLGGRASKKLTYRWSPGNFLSDSASSNPIFNYTAPLDKEITLQYVLTAADGACVRRDTVHVTVYPLPQLTLTGSRSVCPQVEGVMYQVNPTESQSYRWRVNGGTIKNGQGTAAIQVDWGPSNAAAWVEVTPVSKQGCVGLPTVVPVRINVELDTETPQGLAQVCANQLVNNSYRVTNTNGSVYTWGLTGGTLTSGQGTAQVTVTWQGLGDHRIWLQEQSTTRDTVCFGTSDTLQVNVFQDRTTLALFNLSVNLANEKQVIVDWDTSDSTRLTPPIDILRREQGTTAWQPVNTSVAVDTFIDQELNTDEKIYEYQVIGKNGCGEPLTSGIHNTIRLTGETAADGKITLNWNAYTGWPAGVERYEIWRQLDNEPALKLVGQVIASERTFTGASSLAGFAHRFRIKAVAKNSAYVSWSNEIDLTYTHELLAPNIFTPNNDGTNETFTIPLLELYPDNQLTVYNRWGQKVFVTAGYHNEWSAQEVSAGTYFYSLKLNLTGIVLKGWVEIIK